MVEETVEHFNHYVSPGWLAYRKSVSSDSEAGAVLEWQDEGAYCYGLNGEQFIDCLGGFGIYTCGHRNPEILDVVKAQLDHQALHSQELLDPLRGLPGQGHGGHHPRGAAVLLLTNGGAEAVEMALKLARIAPAAGGISPPWGPSTASPWARCPWAARGPTAPRTPP